MSVLLQALLALCASLLGPELRSSELERGEEQAIQAYRAGRYAEAQDLFQSALNHAGAVQGPLLYNLGNCAYRQGLYAQAVLYYARAALRLPDDPVVEFNRRLAEQQLLLETPTDESPLESAQALLDSFSPGPLLALSAALQTAGLIGLVLLSSSRSFRLSSWRRSSQALSLALLLLGLATAFPLVKAHLFAPPLQGVALIEAELRPEPRADLPPTLTLHPGETIRIRETTAQWIQVDGRHGSGWTNRSAVGIVD